MTTRHAAPQALRRTAAYAEDDQDTVAAVDHLSVRNDVVNVEAGRKEKDHERNHQKVNQKVSQKARQRRRLETEEPRNAQRSDRAIPIDDPR